MKAALRRMPGAVRQEIHKTLRTTADEITRQQKRIAPQEDGDLRDSIGNTFGQYDAANANVRGVSSGNTTLGKIDPLLSVTLHAGDEKAFYAKWIEFGLAGGWQIKGRFLGAIHPGFRGQPYFYPPYRASKKPAKREISKSIRRGIKQAIRT